MGLPVTASYIVLAVLAAPSMEMLGASLIASHMLIFWYSQDANVTPPVCLAAYSAAGISGSKPLETGFESWKLAKGIYIIPLLFVYTPILFEGPIWQVIETSIAALLGLFCAAAMFEGFHVILLNWGPAAALPDYGRPSCSGRRYRFSAGETPLVIPSFVLHLGGLALFTGLVMVQKMISRRAAEVALT